MRLELGRERDVSLDDAIREARLEAARRNSHWNEIAEPVRHGPFLVDADSDRLYRLRRGDAFAPASASILTPELELEFYVDRADEVRFVEPVGTPATYAEYVERQAKRGRVTT